MSLTTKRTMSVARNILRQARSSGLRRQSTNAAASSSSSGWTRPVPEGVIPAYDEALKFLSRHSETTLKRANELEQQAKQARGEEAIKLLQAARRLRVEARIDDPATLWAFENGNASSSGADADVLRSLSERRWRQEGGLDLLMERVTQMSVIPDVMPRVEPTIDLQVSYGQAAVIPGNYLLPSQTVEQPRLKVQSFEAEEGLHTLLMVDPDVPDSATASYQQYCHWIVPNIVISPSTAELDLSNPLLPYRPPHPVTSTPYHRYTLVLVRQPEDASPQAPEDRFGFNLRTWLSENGYEHPSDSIKALHMFREGGKGFGRDLKEIGKEAAVEANKEKEVVAKIYRETLGFEPPNFVKAPKMSRYPREDWQRVV